MTAPRSLRLQLLRRLLPALLLLLMAGAATAYWVAWRSATRAYDQALFDTSLAIAEQLRLVDAKPQLPLTQQARAVLLTDKFDQVFYAVHGPDGAVLDGEAGLPMPPVHAEATSGRGDLYYYNGFLRSQPIRVAALRTTLGDKSITVLAGETLVKRQALIREIILGMLLPEILLTLVSISVVWFGVRAGLKPLAELRQELAGRSQADLSPVRVDVPEEIQPVVTEINELLQRLDHSLGSQRNFVSDAAHQLRTPIAALQAQAEAACRESRPDSRQQLEGVLSAAYRLAHLVDQLLALARAEPSLAQTQQEIGLPEIVRQAAETWLPQAIRKGIDLGFELAPARVRGNALLLQEMLSNLLDNALRHAPEGGTITVSCGQSGNEVWLSVEDSGPGIAEAQRSKVFERFYRAPGSPANGNGLGLAIVREIALQHDGRISLGESASLGGALFKVCLPALPVSI
jgi:two-component system, OmpR family, sensor histidine kinase TctE